MYKLVCDQDPKALGIEDEEGNWNLAILEQHIHQCDCCADFTAAILDMLMDKMEDK